MDKDNSSGLFYLNDDNDLGSSDIENELDAIDDNDEDNTSQRLQQVRGKTSTVMGASSCDENIESKKDEVEDHKNSNSDVLECPVCLQTCVYPCQLPCGHIFCFLCVKGVAHRSRRCALCRQAIPPDFFCQPNLLESQGLENPATFDNGYGWFYGGGNGWWQYDERTSQELEHHHKSGLPSCELLIAGFVYTIDLTNMVQIRRNDRTKKRRIKRDLVCLPGRKGIAGLKVATEGTTPESDRPGAEGHEGSGVKPIPIARGRNSDPPSVSPPTPTNTPQTPQTPAESPPTSAEPDLSVQLERLRLDARGRGSWGGSGGSSHGHSTPDRQREETDDVARLRDVSASLAQFVEEEEEEDLSHTTMLDKSQV